ncbi:DUF6701 domain-containing protein [Tamilnaduibacter salinus]|uniref:DUF6701 domain-containing protein n=1 Tax=Tamilnaduibacter salinus TaxID=1484056 RepID=UPI00117E2269|nr:DUF6701 domain-containing protein [Tamilnaduibacter salinus]
MSNSIDQGGWQTVTLRESYTNPVVIAGPVSHNNANSLSARVRNVTPSSFELGVQSPCESSGVSAPGVACPPGGSWNAETVRYLVVEQGRWLFPDGTRVEAGLLNTSTVRSRIGSPSAGETVNFQQSFGGPPAVFHTVNSFNDPAWISSTAFAVGNDTSNRPDATGMSLALEGAEVASSHGAESIGWVAIAPSSGTNNGHAYDIQRSPGLDVDRHEDDCFSLSYAGFPATPDVVASHNTMNGTNGGWLRLCGSEVVPAAVSVHIDEEQVDDAERTGIPEAVSVFAFAADASGLLTQSANFCDGISALFCDDFDQGTLNSDGWQVDAFAGGDAGIGNQTSRSGDASLFTFGGGVNVISPQFDLSEASTGRLSYWWQRGDDSFSEDPDGGEDLVIQYRNDSGQWIDIEVQPGDGSAGQTGSTQFDLPSDAFHSAFQFRFRQQDGNSGDFDFWHVDDVVLRTTPLECEPDAFDRAALGERWATTVAAGGFEPAIVGGRLRITENEGDQSTAASYQRLFPTDDNLIRIEFDFYAYNSGGLGPGDGISLVFSDATTTPQPGGFGGALGYAQEVDGTGGFAGGWLGIGLDEYGNFSNSSEGKEGGNPPGVLTPNAVVLRGAESTGPGDPGYEYIDDSGTLVPGIYTNSSVNPHRYRITLDAQSGVTPSVKIERDTGSGFNTILQRSLTGQPPAPENLIFSVTGSTGGAYNIHELDNLQVCAERIDPLIQIDHFELVHDGQALTCRPEEVTVRACEDAACSSTVDEPVEVTMTPSGWLNGDTFTFSNGSTTESLQVTSAGTVTLDVASSDPSPVAFSDNTTLCDSGSGTPTAAQCALDVRESGFAISVNDHISATTQTATIEALEASAANPEQCVPGLDDVTKNVQLWTDYINPGTGTEPVVVNGGSSLGQSQASASTEALAFGPGGVATLPLTYADAGRVRLNARYEGADPAAPDFGLVLTGNDDFIARPDHFNLSVPGNPAATDRTGNVLTSAGTDFDVQVEAVNANGVTTPNFGRETPTPEGVELQSALFAPSGGQAGTFQGSFNPFGTQCGGSAADGFACGAFNWTEVGVISLTPTLDGDGIYLNSEKVEGDPLPHVGRFVPDRFQTVVDDPGEVQPFCEATTAFSVMGKPLQWRTGMMPVLSVTALSAPGTVTENYTADDGAFQFLTANDINRTFASSDNTATDENGDPFPVAANASEGTLTRQGPGLLHYRFDGTDTLTYLKKEPSPSNDRRPVRVAPFLPDYSITINAVEDSDGVASPQTPLPVSPDFAGAEMRYARLGLENAYGPENQPLTLPFRSTYWNGNEFVLNEDDSCWNYGLPADVSIDTSELSGGSTSAASASGPLDEGVPPSDGQLTLAAPGDGNRGNVGVEFAVPLWLTGDYNGDGSLTNPTGTATFGVYEGHDRVIYWREVGAP